MTTRIERWNEIFDMLAELQDAYSRQCDVLDAAQARIAVLEAQLKDVFASGPLPNAVTYTSTSTSDNKLAIAQARIAMLEGLLRHLEWVGGICGVCLENEQDGHDAGCSIGLALGESNE